MLQNKRIVVEISKADELIMTIDENMLSCKFGALDRGNITDVADWGIYANRGSISFVDTDGYFNSENINSSEVKSFKVQFYLAKSSLSKIATFQIEDASFDQETKIVEMELISRLSRWQDKKTKELFIFHQTRGRDIISRINTEFDVDISCLDYAPFSNTSIYCPYFEEDNLWNFMSKICGASMSRVIEDEGGNPILSGSFPSKTPIVVRPSNIIDISKSEFVQVKNTQLSAVKRIAETNQTYDDTTISFSMEVNPNDDSKSVSFGVPLKFVTLKINYKLYWTTAAGTTTINPNRKIYKVYDAICRSNTKIVNISNGTSTDGTTDKRLTDEEVPFTSSSIYVPIYFTAATYDYNDGASLYYQWERIINSEIKIPVDSFVDDGDTVYYGTKDTSTDKVTTLPTNDLIQTESTYADVPLGRYIVDEVDRRYGKGIECFEIECLFNEYVNESGEVVFDGKDVSQHFKRYDVIIPYVSKNGKTIPLRTNPDGTPKRFRIIGISYSYDGLLRQKLSVQEERYDVD